MHFHVGSKAPRSVREWSKLLGVLGLVGILGACGGGGGSGENPPPIVIPAEPVVPGTGSPGNTPPESLPPAASYPDVPVVAGKISGRITFDLVPDTTSGLNYGNIQKALARGLVVEIVDANGVVLSSGVTDVNGVYSLAATPGKLVTIRVQARLLRADGGWDVRIRDNTHPAYLQGPNLAPIYTMSSSSLDPRAEGEVVDLHAKSGWNNNAYVNSERTAAPFAVLHRIYGAMQKMPMPNQAAFPALNIFWSVNNRNASGNISDGDIGQSNWINGSVREGIYLLGNQNADTDEYDASVVLHEWSHYLENKMGRSDSVGGNHMLSDKLDMRVAWSEGFASGLSGYLRESPTYIDTMGQQQRSTFNYALNKTPSDPGWYSESSVQYFIYHLASMANGADKIRSVLYNDQRTGASYNSIFTFATGLAAKVQGAEANSVDGWLQTLKLPALANMNVWGNGSTYVTPWNAATTIYTTLDSTPVSVCVSTVYGGGNTVDQYRFLRLDIPADGTYKVVSTNGEGATRPILAVNTGTSRFGINDGQAYSFKTGTYSAYVTDNQLFAQNVRPAKACYNLSLVRVN